MPKQSLAQELRPLEIQLVETMKASYEEPKSWSDWEWVARGLMRMFEIKRRPLAVELEYAPEYEIKGMFDCEKKQVCQFCKEPTRIHGIFNHVPVCQKHYELLQQA